MNAFTKFWIFLTFMVILSLLFYNQVSHAQESLIETSVADNKKFSIAGNMDDLFSDLGVKNPLRLNPCLDLGNDARRWCTPHALKQVLTESTFYKNTFVIKVLKTADPCETIAINIEKVCQQENFKKIIRYFYSGKK